MVVFANTNIFADHSLLDRVAASSPAARCMWTAEIAFTTDRLRASLKGMALFASRRHQPAMAALRQARGVDDWSEAR
jgi:hypothetical protein